ncbi:PREDICTED: mucin-5AC [Vollenhovia emeryi]|uniref:mucin-5AC n=1 Tax=Vollenhovia emeryi TaxID=411798 RepID=UPI0005F39D4C|nr:PREDICTED: mucin-5AC [Vollenhovia emeryi]XP_011882264.1 PREDICTED: mucin-5AC [Vollenhovia emeryi]XP_011882265.1 PREDICTED: mucin-5AC [Vollenhovia emeryi]
MLRLMVLLLLCIAATYTPGRCEAGASRDVEHARLPEFLTELDLSSLEASEEDVEALKKIVKRLAPEKNGEYQVYQVFFGNEDLLKEWLKGAGVTGQPGVDYPALTSIPATSFSCRGLRGGYYADLETNCQVFHICDNGRKISFLCPNGTIFQQSQLICDWWFKVDCSKSTELYEQSAEQLAEEEKKRAEARKMKSEFHRAAEQQGNTDYYESVDYDGRQNGRTNPYGQSAAKQNQIPERQAEIKSNQHFGPNNVFDNTRGSGRYYQDNNANALLTNEKTSQAPESFDQPPKQRQYYDGSNYQVSRQRNQLDAQSGKFNYEHNKFQDSRQNYQTNTQDHYQSNQNTPRSNEKPAFGNSKSRTSTRNNLFSSNQSQKATPTYMETTTFRTTTSAPPREYQQFAESAAFVSNRGNRFNSAKSENNRQYYYHSYDYRDRTTVDYRGQETTTVTPQKNEETVSFTPKTGVPPFPGPTFTPIYKPRTTTLPPYETTLQYTPTTETSYYSTPYYKQDDTPETTTYANADATTVTSSSSVEEYPTTSFTTRSDLRTPPAIGRVPPAPANYQTQQYVDNRVTEQRDTDTSFATTRPYVNTESYRHNVANVTSTASQDVPPSTTPFYEDSRGQTHGSYQNGNSIANLESKGTTVDPWRATLQSFQQNSISSTEKPWRSTNAYQQSSSTSKTLSPYDTSFTYKQGKVLSTLGPYIPFTKNYVYSTMTTTPTPKPPTTVPVYNPTLTNYRITASNLIPKVKLSPPVTSKPKDRATYLPEPSTKPSTTLEDRPYAEREHALSMLHSLQGLENNVESLSEIGAKDGNGRNGPSAPGPSTLHSLALYFATAGDNLGSNETVESTASVEEVEDREGSHKESVELPTSILTQHTISSYVELFNLNNALEGNATMAELTSEGDDVGGEVDDDLEIEQSEGPVNGAKRSNNTKLRELAQVFTHALSAYLQDPDTFKKVLTEIRPTQPPVTTADGGQYEITTLYPTTAEEYASVTKEKDEVLDFSDDADVTRRRKPSTIFPTTLQPPVATDRSYSTYYTTPFDEYYTTSESQTRRPVYYPSTTLLPPSVSSYDSRDYVESSTQSGNTFAFEVNRVFTTTMNDIQNYDGDTRDSTDLSLVYDNYFPLDEDGNRNKIGGFQNNTAGTFQPYGKNVQPDGATPISNYVASSTVASFSNSRPGTTPPSWGKGSAGEKPVQNLTPPHYHRFGNVKSFEVSNSILPNQAVRSTTPLSRNKPTYETASSTVQPFRIRYYESTTAPSESLATARSTYAKYRNSYKLESNRIEGTRKPATTTVATTIRDDVETLDPVTVTVSDVTPYTATVIRATPSKPANASTTRHSNLLNNDHWTSSPMVTQLWETTVFVDPRHINHGLESNVGTTQSPDTTGNAINEESAPTVAASTARSPTLSAVDLDVTTEPRTTSTPSPWQWATSDNDPPVTFTLLPTTFAAENTATPTPIITTRSSITTTITSSVTSTNAASRDNLSSTLLPLATGSALNTTENEVIKAHEMFGNLNETSSNTLMRVMKQADSNATVRQLVLLLINHCNGPRNKTMEQEKEQLIDALLRLPVNEFSSEESREIIAGINRLNIPISKLRTVALSNSTTIRTPRASTVRPTPSAPSITTFRSRTGRKFRTTTESASVLARRSDDAVSETNNSLSENEATASDSRALELLRSLYTIAAKWG